MAVTQNSLAQDRLAPILDAVATEMARRSIAIGDPSGAPARLDIRREANVVRRIQAYWTPFQADVPGECIGLHLDIEQPTKHWVEGYVSPSAASWVFCFHTRAVDGDYQLAYYKQQQSDWRAAVTDFFDLAAWYALTPCDLTWSDVRVSIADDVGWTEAQQVTSGGGGAELDKAVQESLKKSTIVWLKWDDAAGNEQTMPVWYIQMNDKMYVVSGERQQTIPNARSLRRAEVIVRWKGHGNAQVAQLAADVKVLPHGPDWDAVAEKLAEKRLNTPGAPEDLAARWRDEADILELTLH